MSERIRNLERKLDQLIVDCVHYPLEQVLKQAAILQAELASARLFTGTIERSPLLESKGDAKKSVQVAANRLGSVTKTVQKFILFRNLLNEGCAKCKTDEAEGAVIDHCSACQRRVTTLAYELFV